MNLEKAKKLIERIAANVEKAVTGKREAVELVMIGLLARSHVLIEDVPGIGKTTLAMAVARSIGARFNRVQMTSDLLPSDIVGGLVFNPKSQEFEVRWGPVDGNIILCDEINRATPKTQSALLECMAESRVTIDRQTLALKDPFMVIATQNPLEYEGCYILGESQKDRFIISFRMGYPSPENERVILKNHSDVRAGAEGVEAVVTLEEAVFLQEETAKVEVSDQVLDYVMKIVEATRKDSRVTVGVSPRGAILLKMASCALALIRGRDYAIYDDVKYLAPFVLAHRIQIATDRYYDSTLPENVIKDCVAQIPVAR